MPTEYLIMLCTFIRARPCHAFPSHPSPNRSVFINLNYLIHMLYSVCGCRHHFLVFSSYNYDLHQQFHGNVNISVTTRNKNKDKYDLDMLERTHLISTGGFKGDQI